MLVLRFVGLIVAALGGAFVGVLIAAPYRTYTTPVGEFPLPHHIPKYAGGVSLRFAMVHDVLHERYPRHGPAYYEERNRIAAIALHDAAATRPPDVGPSADEYALMDDLGVGLEMLGRHEEAVKVMRDKLQQQDNAGRTGRDLYTTYANLGTFLAHWQMAEGFADKPKAQERLREGLGYIHKAITVNPAAHFGREVWQEVALEFLLAVLDKPDLLTQYDMLGDRLDADIDPLKTDRINPDNPHFWGGAGEDREAAAFLRRQEAQKEPVGPVDSYAYQERLRSAITKVGAETGWTETEPSSHWEPAPFDEPTLGIIGMWRLGGGASPHFALALGEIMMRVGQRYIAWCAYERAADLAPAASKDAEIVRRLVAHCRARQAVIEARLSPDEVAAMRPRYMKELAFGRRYQDDYQAYEARRVADGVSLDDAHFYDAFEAAQVPIASPVGPEDKYIAEHDDFPHPLFFPIVLLFSGLFALPGALLLRRVTALLTRAPV